jgi:hypothetical protein
LCISHINELGKRNGDAKVNSLLFVFKLNISLIDVHTITLKRRLNELYYYLWKEKCLITFLKVNMTNLTLLVVVGTVLN